jgi:hypothetical protein
MERREYPITAILLILLPGLFLADILHGLLLFNGMTMPVSLLSVVRGAVLLAAVLLIILNRESLPPKYLYLIALLLMFAVPGVATSLFRYEVSYDLFYEARELSKVLYGPILVLMYFVLIHKLRISTTRLLLFIEYTAYFVGVSLLVMQVLGIGYSEGQGSIWAKGFFSSQNDISLALALLLSVAVYNNITNPGVVRFVLMLMSLSGLALIGQRVALASVVLIPIAVLAVLIYGKSSTWSGGRKKRSLSLVIPFSVLTLVMTGYLGYKNIDKLSRPITKVISNIEGYGQRFELFEVGKHRLQRRSTVEKVFGEGATSYQKWIYKIYVQKPPGGYRLVEMDWMDLYGAYGFTFVVLIYSILIYVWIRLLHSFIRNRCPETGLFLLMVSLYILTSLVVGHALSGPMPTSVIAPVIAVALLRWWKIEQPADPLQ